MHDGIADIGSHLRRAREQRGLTLRDIADATKISMRALNAIEHNDFARLPGGVFRKAYVRAFAAEVGLDADKVAREYRATFEPEILVDPLLMPGGGCDDRARRLRRAAAVAAAAGGLLIAGLLLLKPAQIPQGPPGDERMLNEVVAVNEVVAGRPDGTVLSDQPEGIDEASFATAAVVEAGDPALRLEIRLTGLCWVSAEADGERVLYRLMQPGERTVVEARRAITLRVGDAGTVAYSINGAMGRPLGEKGEAITVRITSDTLGGVQAAPASRLPNTGADAQFSPGSVRSDQGANRRRDVAI